MKAESLKDELIAGCLALAWDQWSQLGVSAVPPARSEERAADPEALLLFTLDVGRNDPRLFDELLDWFAANEELISVHRLRNLCVDALDKQLVDAALDWSLTVRGRKRPSLTMAPSAQLTPLFMSTAPSGQLDPSFTRYGFARRPAHPSGKSQPPRVRDPIAFAFRLRRLLGVGVRAEVVRALLTIRASRVSGKVITASAAFAQRNVREGLTQLVDAGVIEVAEISDDRQYSIRQADWATLLGLPAAPDLPFHHDWIPSLRALTRIVRWLQEPGLDDLSPYLKASQARSLVDELAPDLRYAGVPLGAFTALGTDFWDDFAAIARMLLTKARRSG